MINNIQALEELIQMSKYAGERFDLVQAGGGNTSVKYASNKMYIKASGYLLSELSENKGHTVVDIEKVLFILDDEKIIAIKNKKEKDRKASEKLAKAIVNGTDRPSIETYLHALLYKYTFHVHAISVNMFTSHLNWLEKMKELDETALCIPYETPGIELALELKKRLAVYESSFNRLPNIIFLQNHGLIVSSDKLEDITTLTEKIVKRAENMAGVNFSKYRNTTKLSACFNSAFDSDSIAYLSEDRMIYSLLNSTAKFGPLKPFSPDGYVFCGYTLLELNNLDESALKDYHTKYFETPKLIMYKDWLYIIATDLKKAKMIEDVLKNNLLIADTLGANLTYLKDEEISYLGNWEAEKYRQKLS